MRIAYLTGKKRIWYMLIGFLFGCLILWARLFYVQIIRGEEIYNSALTQRLRPIPVDGARGDILDRNGVLLAGSENLASVYVIPVEIKDKPKVAELLSRILNLDKEQTLERIQKRAAAVWLKKRITQKEAMEIRNLAIQGVGIVESPKRVYPFGSLAAHIIGISGIDNQGLEGMELVYDHWLTGGKGSYMVERDASGREVPEAVKVYEIPKKGDALTLSIDISFQSITEKALAKRVIETGAKSGLAIFLDVLTGEVLSMASYPTFEPENYQDYPAINRRNIAVTDLYEPGSTFKVMTAAAALEEGITSLDRRFFDPGFMVVSGWRIRCWRSGGHGSQTFTETLENSCNIAYATLGLELGGDKFNYYARKYGFGQKTGIDFPGEATGLIYKPGPKVPLVTWANMGFGQSISITPLQLVSFVAAIANGGILYVPHLVKQIGDDKPIEPKGTRILDEKTAKTLREMLLSVVENGSGRTAQVAGYRIGGKTGTAQMVIAGRYSHTSVIASFVGLAPAESPAIAGIIAIHEPTTMQYGGQVSAPVFAAIASAILPALGIKPIPETIQPNPWGGPAKRIPQSEVVVPNVIGKSVYEAQKELKTLSLIPETVGDGPTITDQVPQEKQLLKEGSKVYLFTDFETCIDGLTAVDALI
jgi:stage V sporulation protein D (sporulation-specific penicillin-binding protein)